MRRVLALLFALFALFAASPAAAATLYVGKSEAGAKSYVTIAEALKDLQPGDELVIGAGTYRESIMLPTRDWGKASTLIRGELADKVLIKGSDLVADWQPAGEGVFVKRGWRANTQQVFVDGEPLKQIGGSIMGGYPEKSDHPLKKLHATQGGIWPGRIAGGKSDLVQDSFFYDAAQETLYIKVRHATLDGHQVEASVRPYLIFGKGLRNVTIRDLQLRHSNTTSLNQAGAVTLLGDDLVVERLSVTQTDGNGFDLTGDRITVNASTANYCGQVGLKVRGRGNRIADSTTSYNNTRGFNKWWEAGGAKFVGEGGLRDSEVVNHRAIGNNGDGLWFDWMNDNNKVLRSVIAYNAGFGIQYEASSRARIEDNIVFANVQRGIYLPNSPGSVVAHNLVVNNGMEGIVVLNERAPSRPELDARSARVVGNVLAWNRRAAVILPAEDPDSVSDYNVFLHEGEPPMFSQGWATRGTPVRRGLQEWTEASRQDAHSRDARATLSPELRQAMDAKQIPKDWSALLTDADRLGVRLEGAAAGPKRER